LNCSRSTRFCHRVEPLKGGGPSIEEATPSADEETPSTDEEAPSAEEKGEVG